MTGLKYILEEEYNRDVSTYLWNPLALLIYTNKKERG
jgi:hypothetical protein